MNNASDWGGTAPTLAATGVFSSALSAGNAGNLTLGGDMALLRLEFQNISGPLTIAAGNTLTLGAVSNQTNTGIQMNNAGLNHDVTINAALVNVGTIRVKSGRTLTLSGGATNISSLLDAGSLHFTSAASQNYTFLSGLIYNMGTWASPSSTGVRIGNNSVVSVGGSVSGIGSNADGIVRVDGSGAQFTAGSTSGSVVVGRAAAGRGLLQVDNGTLSILRDIVLGHQLTTSSGRGILRINGGITTVTTTVDVLSSSTTATTTPEALFEVNGGTTTIGSSIRLGISSTVGLAELKVTGGTLYIGINGVGIAAQGTGSSTYSITLSGGTIGASTATVGGGWSSAANMTLGTTNGDITFQAANASSAARNITLSGVLSGNGGLQKTGAGNLTLSGANSYSGTTKVNAGSLVLSNNLALQNSALDTSGSGNVTLSSGITTPTLGGLIGSTNLSTVITGNYSLMTALSLNPGTSVTNTYSGVITNGASGMTLTKSGNGTQVLSGASTYTGSTTISGGTLQLGNGGTTGSIANSASITIGTGATLKTNRSDSITLSQAITGAGNVEIANTSSGSTILGSNSNAYTGTTTVSSGTLQVGSSGTGTSGTGAMTVQTGSTILGTGVVQGSSFAAESGSHVHAGDTTAHSSYGTLTFTPVSGSGSFDFQSGSSVILGINPGGVSDKLNFIGTGGQSLLFNGNLTVTASGYTPLAAETFNLIDWGNLSTVTFASRFSAGSYSGYLLGNGDDNLGFDLPDISSSGYAWDISNFITNGTIMTVVIPEPSRALLLMLGVAGLTTRRRRSAAAADVGSVA